jgi:hypothetical protein
MRLESSIYFAFVVFEAVIKAQIGVQELIEESDPQTPPPSVVYRKKSASSKTTMNSAIDSNPNL